MKGFFFPFGFEVLGFFFFFTDQLSIKRRSNLDEILSSKNVSISTKLFDRISVWKESKYFAWGKMKHFDSNVFVFLLQ